MNGSCANNRQWVESTIASDEAYWTERAGQVDALPEWLSIRENIERHRALALFAYEAVLYEHPCHKFAGETLDWYRVSLMEILHQGYWSDVNPIDFQPRARRYVAVWLGLRVLKSLLDLRMDSATYAAVLMRAMGLVGLAGSVVVPSFAVKLDVPPTADHHLNAEEDEVVRAVFDEFDGRIEYPKDLDDVKRIVGREVPFETFDEFIVAEANFENQALTDLVGDVESDPAETTRRLCGFISMMSHNYSGMVRLRVDFQSRGLADVAPHHDVVAYRMAQRHLMIRELCAALGGVGVGRPREIVELDAIIIQAMWIGLTIQALYRPHSFDMGAELYSYIASVVGPNQVGFSAKLGLLR